MSGLEAPLPHSILPECPPRAKHSLSGGRHKTGVVPAIRELTFSRKEDRQQASNESVNKIIAGMKDIIRNINLGAVLDKDKLGGRGALDIVVGQ